MYSDPLTPPMTRPNALYSLNNQKTAAGLDALLHGSPGELEGLTEFLSVNRVILGDGGFCFLAAKINAVPTGAASTLLDANGIFAELLEEELLQKAIYYMVPLRGLVLCLIAMPYYRPNSKQLPVTNQFLWDSAKTAMEHFRQQTGLEIMASVSPTCFGLDSVPGTFHRTLDLLQFHRYFGQTDGICEPRSVMQRRPIRLSSEFQEQCSSALNLLLAGQQDEFYRCIERNLENIRDLVPSSLQQYQTLIYQYLDLLCYNLVDHHLADAAELERTDLFWLTHEAASFRELTKQVRDLITKLTAPMAGMQKRSNALLVDKMKAYMQLHHTDSNLTVSAVAAEFGMSQPVFSACFIRHAGTGPLDYLNKLRVQTTLELLKANDEPLSQIAQKAGFGSVSTMHRIFKKVTGMTPAQVRNGTT